MLTAAATALTEDTYREDVVVEDLTQLLGEDAMPGTCICWTEVTA